MKEMTEGELWSWVRSVMSQGADIRCDYDQGTHKTYERYSARLDAAAAERAQELWARLKTPNVRAKRTPNGYPLRSDSMTAPSLLPPPSA